VSNSQPSRRQAASLPGGWSTGIQVGFTGLFALLIADGFWQWLAFVGAAIGGWIVLMLILLAITRGRVT
jgi:hypothetical protein